MLAVPKHIVENIKSVPKNRLHERIVGCSLIFKKGPNEALNTNILFVIPKLSMRKKFT